MTVKRGGLAKSKRVRQAKSGKTPVAAEAPRSPLPGESWHITPNDIGATGFFFPKPGSTGDGSFEDPADTTPNQESLLTADVPSDLSEGPTTPPTTYGTESVTVGGPLGKGKGKGVGKAKKATGSGRRGEKGGLYGRLAKTTGTTRKEARGVMKRARRQVRSGNRKAAARRISRALAGGPSAGVRRTPARRAAAEAAGKKISKRIQTRQSAATRGAGPGGDKKRKKK